MADGPSSQDELLSELSDLRARLADAEETLRAIREGEVDALVVSVGGTERIYTLEGADKAYRVLIETMLEGAVTTSEDGTILYANGRFAALVRASIDAIIGRSLHEYISPEGREWLEEILEHGWGNGKYIELELKAEDGSIVPAYASVNKFNLDGKPGICFVVTDLSEQKEAERLRSAELERLIDERTEDLKEANRELDAYAHTVSHDLRNPLTAVILANEVLRDALDDPDNDTLRKEVEESCSAIGRNVSKAYALINDLLMLAEAGSRPQETVDIEVSEIVDRVLDENAASIERSSVEVVRDSYLGTVRASETHVYQLFSNLIGNAIKHNDNPQPSFTIEHMSDSETAHSYKVCDNSSGFPEDKLDSILEPFTKKGMGTGIGLAIVKKVVDVYGGTIKAYNDDGACVEFTIYDFVE